MKKGLYQRQENATQICRIMIIMTYLLSGFLLDTDNLNSYRDNKKAPKPEQLRS